MIAVVVVLYRDYEDVDNLLRRQSDPSRSAVRWIIVDNTEVSERQENWWSAWCDLRPDVEVLVPEKANLGYFGAVRFAVVEASVSKEVDFLLVSNADLTFDALAFSAVLARLEREAGVEVIAPSLVDARGQLLRQRHLMKRPSARQVERLLRIYNFYPFAIVHRAARELKSLWHNQQAGSWTAQRRIYAPHGALMIFSRNYFELQGAFDHPGFLFGEEIYVGEFSRSNGMRCLYLPELAYSHKEHGSMGSFPSRWIVSQLRDGHAAVLALLE